MKVVKEQTKTITIKTSTLQLDAGDVLEMLKRVYHMQIPNDVTITAYGRDNEGCLGSVEDFSIELEWEHRMDKPQGYMPG